MGYYTNLAAAFLNEDNDYSYTSPERELFWRMDDLELMLMYGKEASNRKQ